MGIHRINWCFIEEFNSPGDLRFRIETDIRMPPTAAGRRFVGRLRRAVAASRHEEVRDLLLERLERPVSRRKDLPSEVDLTRVRRLVTGALSDPRKPPPGDRPAPGRRPPRGRGSPRGQRRPSGARSA
jgi:hypothetical protein